MIDRRPAGMGRDRRWRGAAAAAAALGFVLCAPARGEDDPAALRQGGLEARSREVIAEGRIKAYAALSAELDEAAKRLSGQAPPAVGVTAPVWDQIARALADFPEEPRRHPAERRKKAAASAGEQMNQALARARGAWIAAAEASGEAEKGAELEGGEEGGEEPSTPAALGRWPARFRERLVPLAAGLVALGLLLVMIDQRRAIRTALRARAGRAAAIVLACGLALGAAGCGDRGADLPIEGEPGTAIAAEPDAEEPEPANAEEVARLKDWAGRARGRAAAAEAKAKAAQDEVLRKARQLARQRLGTILPQPDAPLAFNVGPDLLEPKKGSGQDYVDRILAAQAEPQAELVAAIGSAGAVAELIADHDRTVKERRDHPERAAAAAATRRRHLREHGTRLALSVGAVLSAAVPLVVARRRRRRRLREVAVRCPRCEARGTLAEVDYGLPYKQLQCAACGYEFEKSYVGMERLCFPTVGMPSSGKSFWMLTLYDLLNKSFLPRGATFRVLPSRFNALVDQVVDHVLVKRMNVPANQYIATEITDPLVFYIKDRRGISGSSEVLLNLFDFSGEIMFSATYQDLLRQRALACDGAFVFLDPTNPNYVDQNNQLMRFINELRLFRHNVRHSGRSAARQSAPVGVDFNRKLDLPVAVCIPKIDLLVTHNPMGDSARKWVAELRATAGWPLSQETVRWRSAHIKSRLGQMFPGGNLAATLDRELGGRVMFFPVCPVSIEEAELGITDLQQRAFLPFGILEPVYWMMHMNGYNMLS